MSKRPFVKVEIVFSEPAIGLLSADRKISDLRRGVSVLLQAKGVTEFAKCQAGPDFVDLFTRCAEMRMTLDKTAKIVETAQQPVSGSDGGGADSGVMRTLVQSHEAEDYL